MIGDWRLSVAAEALGVAAPSPDAVFDSVSVDTRTLGPGALFVALRGERGDGHDFVPEAMRKGAVAALTSRDVDADAPAIRVADTRRALGELAALNRSRFTEPLVAVTGSAGKTTCKELIAAILSCRGEILATSGNRNNEIGAPLTLLDLSERHRAAVIELGAARRGEIATLAAWARPDVALITNAMMAHLRSFGSLQAIVESKGEILAALPPHGVATLNADDPAFEEWRERAAPRRVISFGRRADADCRLLESADGVLSIDTPAGRLRPNSRLLGGGNAMNIAAATAVAVALDIELSAIDAGIAAARAVDGRLQALREAGPRIIDDAYNANPGSVSVALDLLADMGGRRLLILGEMAELGEASEQCHRDVGRRAAEMGLELWCCGAATLPAAAAFGDAARHFADREALREHLPAALACDVVLLKGSRVAGLDVTARELAALAEEEGDDAGMAG